MTFVCCCSYKLNTIFTAFKLTVSGLFVILIGKYYLRGGIFNMDDSDSDSEANQFNRFFIYISQGMDYIFRI